MYINKAIIIGNLTKDPEVKKLPNGTTIASMSIATNRVYKDRDGKKQEDTEYHNVSVFGVQADNAGRYLKKGQSVYIEGRISTRSWEKDGEKKYRTEIVAESVQFGAKAGGTTQVKTEESKTEEVQGYGNALDNLNVDDINPEDIPF